MGIINQSLLGNSLPEERENPIADDSAFYKLTPVLLHKQHCVVTGSEDAVQYEHHVIHLSQDRSNNIWTNYNLTSWHFFAVKQSDCIMIANSLIKVCRGKVN